MSNSVTVSGDLLDTTGGTARSEGGLQVLPFYIVCDESSSMAGAAVDAVNDGIVELFDTLNEDPIIDAKVRVGIVAFNDTARLLFPLTQLSQVTQIPVCVASGSTSYAAAFRLLKTQLETDVAALQQQFNVHRPCVFFMSDGAPNNENWRAELSKLTDASFKFSPNIVSFGVAGAEKSVIAEVAHWGSRTGTKFFFMAENDGSPGAAIKEIIKFIIQTIVASAKSNQAAFQITDGAVIGGNGPGAGGVTTFVIDPLNP
jgi:uncharacterized protein YegL